MAEHVNEQEKFKLNGVEEHTDKIVVLLPKNNVIKQRTINIETNSHNSRSMYHHLVYVDTISMNKETN